MADNQRMDDLRRRVQRDPASIAFAQLAEECRRAGMFAEAVDSCRAGLAIHPNYLSARVTLGRSLLDLDLLDEAQTELDIVAANAPENLAAIRGLADIHYRRGDLTQALALYKAALTIAHNDPDLECMVEDLSREVEKQLPEEAADNLWIQQDPPEATVDVLPSLASLSVDTEPPESIVEIDDHLIQTLAALQQFLDAVHVARAGAGA